VLLVVTYSRRARETLRNACRAHEETVVRRFGRAALLQETEFGAFLACRLRERHGGDVQVEQTEPFNEFADTPDAVREAAAAYENRDSPSTPYDRFAAGTEHPESSEMRGQEL
jgi:cytochrome c peroxidase